MGALRISVAAGSTGLRGLRCSTGLRCATACIAPGCAW